MSKDMGASAKADRATHKRSRVAPSPPSVSVPSAGRAWLDVNAAYLRDALDLPENCKILGSQSGNNGIVALLVESPDIHPDAMIVRAVFAGAFGGSNFHGWKIIAKRDPGRRGTEV